VAFFGASSDCANANNPTDFCRLNSRHYLPQVVLAIVCVSVLFLFHIKAQAADQSQPQHCQSVFSPNYLNVNPRTLLTRPYTSQDDILYISADHANVEQQSIFHLEGNVVLQQNDVHMRADRVVYNQSTDIVSLRGLVHYQTPRQILLGQHADMNLKKDTGIFIFPRFWLLGSHYRGSADSVNVLDRNVMHFNNAVFTSCDNEQQDWVLRASELHLDQAKNKGVARHARIEFMHVPFFYFPYLSFPLEGRKSGFLWAYPGKSNLNGTEFTVPYYFNIAPHRDATLTVRHYSKRGTQLIGEFRYLNKKNQGQLDVEYLPDDDLSGSDRASSVWRHQGAPAMGWRTEIQYNDVSDGDYFNEFGNNLNVASLTHLQRHAALTFRDQNWQLNARVQSYQTLDDSIAKTAHPYQLLPRLQLNALPRSLGLGLMAQFNAEAVSFDRAEGVVGRRLDLQPRISWRHQGAPGFIESSLKLGYTRYDLDKHDPDTESSPSRSLPTFTLDSGLFFERDVTWKQQPLLQTLEPRLFYLYVPFRQQDNLVVDGNGQSKIFDSSLPQFNFSQLFRDNRFNGVDRVGDANQLSFSLTSRFLNDTGKELFRASIGQIAYFRDRKVVLPGGSVQTQRQSDTVAEMRSQWNRHINTQASLLWSNGQDNIRRGSLKFRYQFDRNRMIDLAYRYERDAIDQANIAVLWPLHPQWKFMSRWHYSLLDELRLETFVGLEYDSCCWALRLVRREYISNLDDESRKDSILLQLELKGLASVGRKIGTSFGNALLNDSNDRAK